MPTFWHYISDSVQYSSKKVKGHEMSYKNFYYILFQVATFVIQILAAPSEKILSGFSSADQSPYLVSLRVNNIHFCSGTIIAPDHVLTSADCLHHARYKMNILCEDIFVVAGATDTLVNGVQRRVLKCEIHPYYVPDPKIYFPNDTAILVLNRNFKMGKDITYLLIAPPNTNYTNQMGILSAWCISSLPDGSVIRYLRKLQTRILNHNDCQSRVDQPSIIRSSQICTLTSVEQVCNCRIDGGSPLVFNNTLIGVASFGFPCGIGFPDVFTSVTKFWIFIRDTLQMAEDKKKNKKKKLAIKDKTQLKIQ